ncbi:MAG: DMT family transporter [Actinomycetota bacterium]
MTDTPAATPVGERVGIIAAGAGVVLWAIGPVIVKGTDVEGLAFAFHRSWLGALMFTAALWLTGGRLTMRALWRSRWGIVALTADLAFFFSAVKLTTVANSMVISALQPAIILVLVGPLFGERVQRAQVGWTLVSIIGVALVAVGSAGEVGWNLDGDLLAVLAVLAWAGYFIASKDIRRDLGALEYQAALFVGCAVLLAPMAVVSGQDLTVDRASTAVAVVAMAALAGIGHVLINWAHPHVRLSITSLLTLGLPVVSALAAWAFIDEPLVALQLAGIGVVIVALAMVITRTSSVEAPAST